MPNLAHAISQNQGEILHFPKTGQNAMSKKDDGFTRLPNALIDSQIMAELNDKAFKCLMLIIRQTLGFDRESHTISITQFQKFCGIKKRDTVMSSIQILEDAKLVAVQRKKGQLNSYKPTLNQYQQKVPVPTKGTSTVDSDGTSTVDSDEGSPTKRGTKKENIKYKFKNIKKDDSPVDNLKAEMFGDSVEYHVDNKNLYSLRELAGVYPIQSDLTDQAKQIDPDFEDSKIMSELKNFAQWSTSQQKTTAQGWMNYWIYRIQNLKTPKAKPQSQKPSKPKSKALSDKQIDFFASKLCNQSEFASMFSNVGESQKEFEVRISACLRDVNNVKKWASYLHSVGFVGQLEDFA